MPDFSSAGPVSESEGQLMVILIRISLVMSGVEHLFGRLWTSVAVGMSSLEKSQFRFFAHFLN